LDLKLGSSLAFKLGLKASLFEKFAFKKLALKISFKNLKTMRTTEEKEEGERKGTRR
jgi:hypothetical protein